MSSISNDYVSIYGPEGLRLAFSDESEEVISAEEGQISAVLEEQLKEQQEKVEGVARTYRFSSDAKEDEEKGEEANIPTLTNPQSPSSSAISPKQRRTAALDAPNLDELPKQLSTGKAIVKGVVALAKGIASFTSTVAFDNSGDYNRAAMRNRKMTEETMAGFANGAKQKWDEKLLEEDAGNVKNFQMKSTRKK